MKKILMIFVCTLVCNFTLASVCELEQKNAASYTLAQEAKVPVQNVEVLQFEETALSLDFNVVEVSVKTEKGLYGKRYLVFIKSKAEENCEITDVTEDFIITF